MQSSLAVDLNVKIAHICIKYVYKHLICKFKSSALSQEQGLSGSYKHLCKSSLVDDLNLQITHTLLAVSSMC